MTVAELATLFYHVHLESSQQATVTLEVLQMQGWEREMHFGLPFVMPSPNMPTEDTALVYPGCGIFEGTTLSEGRGTTRPFEIIGAGYLDWRFAAKLRAQQQQQQQQHHHLAAADVSGMHYREAYFTPTFSKFEGNLSSGVEIYVEDRKSFTSVDTALEILLAAKGARGSGGGGSGFEWVDGTGANFDLHLGNNSTRLAIEAGASLEEIVAGTEKKTINLRSPRLQVISVKNMDEGDQED
eukprot:gene22599-32103_t